MNKEKSLFFPTNDTGILKPSRVYIDCTETYLSGLNTGIQRVVQNIVLRAPILEDHFGILCVPVIAVGGKYLALSTLKGLGWYIKKRGVLIKKIRFIYVFVEKILKKNKTIESENNNINLKKIPQYCKYFVAIINWIMYLPIILLFLIEKFKNEVVEPKSGDLIILPDAFWRNKYILDSAENASKNKAMIIPLIHDLFPISMPSYMSKVFVDQFSESLPRLLAISSGILTTTQTTKDEIHEYLTSFDTVKMKTLPISFFYLGCDFRNISDFSQPEMHDGFPFQYVDSLPYYLMVGTMEPRKGHEVVFDAFEYLWDHGEKIALVIVGRIGWKCEKILRKIQTSSYQNKLLFFYDEVSDQDLGIFYRMTKGLILASFGEGFGLPLVEAMHYGVPVIASDLPVFYELASDYPLYFEKGNSGDLAQVIKMHMDGTVNWSRKHIHKKPLTWDESVESFMMEALRLYAQNGVCN